MTRPFTWLVESNVGCFGEPLLRGFTSLAEPGIDTSGSLASIFVMRL
jgi:hypothetical protein